jgi:ribulose-5-phosphate 4-epimerase/fuculose-1-phosphate aldolase
LVISLGVHFGLLKASDMVHINEAGEVIGGAQRPVSAAGFMIHSAIHKARPDINAVCHTHSPAGKAWSTFGRHVDIINQDSCTFYEIQTVYENFGGVVLEKAEGERIAAVLGDKNRVAILQNHGLLTAGSTVDEVAYLFTSLERTCEVQIMVESTNLPKKRIGHDEAQFTANVNADPVGLNMRPPTGRLLFVQKILDTNSAARQLYIPNSSWILSTRFGSQRES